jgi:hypothetical protein
MFSKVVKIEVMFHFCIVHHVGVSLDTSVFVDLNAQVDIDTVKKIAPIFTTIV